MEGKLDWGLDPYESHDMVSIVLKIPIHKESRIPSGASDENWHKNFTSDSFDKDEMLSHVTGVFSHLGIKASSSIFNTLVSSISEIGVSGMEAPLQEMIIGGENYLVAKVAFVFRYDPMGSRLEAQVVRVDFNKNPNYGSLPDTWKSGPQELRSGTDGLKSVKESFERLLSSHKHHDITAHGSHVFEISTRDSAVPADHYQYPDTKNMPERLEYVRSHRKQGQYVLSEAYRNVSIEDHPSDRSLKKLVLQDFSGQVKTFDIQAGYPIPAKSVAMGFEDNFDRTKVSDNGDTVHLGVVSVSSHFLNRMTKSDAISGFNLNINGKSSDISKSLKYNTLLSTLADRMVRLDHDYYVGDINTYDIKDEAQKVMGSSFLKYAEEISARSLSSISDSEEIDSNKSYFVYSFWVKGKAGSAVSSKTKFSPYAVISDNPTIEDNHVKISSQSIIKAKKLRNVMDSILPKLNSDFKENGSQLYPNNEYGSNGTMRLLLLPVYVKAGESGIVEAILDTSSRPILGLPSKRLIDAPESSGALDVSSADENLQHDFYASLVPEDIKKFEDLLDSGSLKALASACEMYLGGESVFKISDPEKNTVVQAFGIPRMFFVLVITRNGKSGFSFIKSSKKSDWDIGLVRPPISFSTDTGISKLADSIVFGRGIDSVVKLKEIPESDILEEAQGVKASSDFGKKVDHASGKNSITMRGMLSISLGKDSPDSVEFTSASAKYVSILSGSGYQYNTSESDIYSALLFYFGMSRDPNRFSSSGSSLDIGVVQSLLSGKFSSAEERSPFSTKLANNNNVDVYIPFTAKVSGGSVSVEMENGPAEFSSIFGLIPMSQKPEQTKIKRSSCSNELFNTLDTDGQSGVIPLGSRGVAALVQLSKDKGFSYE